MNCTGVGGSLQLRGFLQESKACVIGECDMSKWFEVNVSLRQGCMISPWSSNVYITGIVRKANTGYWGGD